MRFFLGIHQPSDAGHTEAAFVSVNRLRTRKKPMQIKDWIMDSGAFTEIATYGGYRELAEVYAAQIRRWKHNGNLLAAVAQDFMCEGHMLAKTDATNVALVGMWPVFGPATADTLIAVHQLWTIERYDALTACDTGGVHILPVLQGYSPESYVAHIHQYGARLLHGMWVGVGSVCKRNGDPAAIEAVLAAIKTTRPDLRLHGFGIKQTALGSEFVRNMLHTADSMAWSYAARLQGRNPNDIQEGLRYAAKVAAICELCDALWTAW